MKFSFPAHAPRALVLATAVALVAGSATVASASTAAAGPPPTVAGHVYDDVTGAPVGGVEVALVPVDDPDLEVWSDSGTDGSYALSALEPGSYTLRANDFRGRYVMTSSAVFNLAPAEQVTGKDVRLTPAVTITGLAVDAVTGDPLVSICPSAFAGRDGELLHSHSECSGLDGRWSARALVAGPTTVALGGDAEHAGLWIGGGASRADATVFTTQAGATRR
jgi:hypothetical protein